MKVAFFNMDTSPLNDYYFEILYENVKHLTSFQTLGIRLWKYDRN